MRPTRARFALCILVAVSAGWASDARAFGTLAAELPCTLTATTSGGATRPCITCHDNSDGGGGCVRSPCLNPFGMSFDAAGRHWTTALALLDSDADGYTNGQELGDPTGAWMIGFEDPVCSCATRPGFATSRPGETDRDGDRYCCRGHDADGDGDCLDDGENDGSADCDEADPLVRPGAVEICDNLGDDDCDALATEQDPDCAPVRDRDGDGFCPTGRDANRDRDCVDADEMSGPGDCDDERATVSPGSPENCFDTLDNDCDLQTDLGDPTCRPDVDVDSDGWCPVGQDLNHDGDCLDADEEVEMGDCADSDARANPEQTEDCLDDGLDNDCDGLSNADDPECRGYFDQDGDDYCPLGRDGNGDGDCADPGEPGDVQDCDDELPSISPGASERCTDLLDDDCDMLISLADPDCATHLDSDGDRWCEVGFDMNGNGRCGDSGEATGGDGDCDDHEPMVHPDSVEVCLNGADDDCDGSADAFDRADCRDYDDSDGDGFCVAGHDEDGDLDCADPGEQGEPNDAGHDDDPTVWPGAPENCLDRKDNDLDGLVDEADSCSRDHDDDGDGYCPIGQDTNDDGDCLDPGDNVGVSDCDDGDPEQGPGATEQCRRNVDLDCDGDIGLLDADCFVLLDRDGDGFCGTGIDDNGNGSCLDEGEDRFGADCDDLDAAVSARAVEACDNGIDDDCDGLIDAEDASCPCDSDSACNDSDPCTADTCSAGACSHAPACSDAGPPPPPPMPPAREDDGCGCRTAGAPHAPGPAAWWPAAALAIVVVSAVRRASRQRRRAR